MNEHSESILEHARLYRERLLGDLLGELYCDGRPMTRSDRYDKLGIKQTAVEYLEGAGVTLPRSGEHANAIERVLRETKYEGRHEIPGAVMAIVVSEGLFRPESALSLEEKEALFTRTGYALVHAQDQEKRGGLKRFGNDLEYRARLMLRAQGHTELLATDGYQERYELYRSMFKPMTEENIQFERQSVLEKPKEKISLFRRFGRHLLGGLTGLAFMGGPAALGPEHQVEGDDEIDDPDDEQRYRNE